MSRIGKIPVPIPAGVEVKIGDEVIEVKGPKGSLTTPVSKVLDYEIKDNHVHLT
ncbi:MAG: 50S ribosomal protein L6, partial [Desulfovibrio sp.]|nr:50S ribosomal protein L6 [Desulfovibrio sp.]